MSNLIDDMALHSHDGGASPHPAANGGVPAPTGGWLRAGRKARGVSQQKLAEKLGFKRQAWAQLEASEAREAISLYSLRRAADALGYDLVYFLVPRESGAGEPAEFHPRHAGEETQAHETRPRREVVSPWATQDLPTELR